MWCFGERNWCCPYARVPANNCLSKIWANQSMKRKCWLFCTSLIFGALIYWGNASKLRRSSKPQVFSGTTHFLPRATKMGDYAIWIWLWDHLQKRQRQCGCRCTFLKIWRWRIPFFSFLHCTRVAPSRSPGMTTRSQKFASDPTIAVQCSSFPRVLFAPWRTSIQRPFVFK